MSFNLAYFMINVARDCTSLFESCASEVLLQLMFALFHTVCYYIIMYAIKCPKCQMWNYTVECPFCADLIKKSAELKVTDFEGAAARALMETHFNIKE